ncbi:PPR3B phosphatase, partial [Nothoprocta pentlandii]|nr:PPR3B phosphatase [Nothoprocta pentlandii]
MAVDVAMQLYVCPSPLRREKRGACKAAPAPPKPLRPCIQPGGGGTAPGAPARGKAKKRVSFADSRGFALTMVKVFSEFDEPLELPLGVAELLDSLAGLAAAERDSFVLDFAQPSSDYLAFRSRLHADCVCLESCALRERSVAGTVKVRNLAFEKAVRVRMTFDTWKTFTDYPCHYVRDVYEGSAWDTFSFDISLPEGIPPHERVEFAVSFECGGRAYWDSNGGANYRITRAGLKWAREAARPPAGPDWAGALDQFGSPRCSYGLFAEWPSYSGYEKLGPYY